MIAYVIDSLSLGSGIPIMYEVVRLVDGERDRVVGQWRTLAEALAAARASVAADLG